MSAAAGRDWGSRLTEGVARNLRLHFSRVSDANRKLTAEDIARLVGARRLNYLVGGIIESLTPPTGGSPWRLGVTYSLQRAVPGRLQLVQKERIEESSRAGAALGVSDLEVLVDGAAARIAGRLAPAITGDILAVRD